MRVLFLVSFLLVSSVGLSMEKVSILRKKSDLIGKLGNAQVPESGHTYVVLIFPEGQALDAAKAAKAETEGTPEEKLAAAKKAYRIKAVKQVQSKIRRVLPAIYSSDAEIDSAAQAEKDAVDARAAKKKAARPNDSELDIPESE